jgi:hypothetical protein
MAVMTILRLVSDTATFGSTHFHGCYKGDVWWLDEADAFSQGLAYVNEANRAVIKVDNTSNVSFNQKRNSVGFTPLVFSSRF